MALAANGVCLGLLWRHRQEDVNMASVWEWSRNDIAANISVLVAAGAVWFFGSGWPDVVIGSLLALLFLRKFRGLKVRLGAAVAYAEPRLVRFARSFARERRSSAASIR